jgi:hypothetical protein
MFATSVHISRTSRAGKGDRHFPQGVNGMGSVYLNELALDFALQLQASVCIILPANSPFMGGEHGIKWAQIGTHSFSNWAQVAQVNPTPGSTICSKP